MRHLNRKNKPPMDRDHGSLARCTSIASVCHEAICPSHRPENYVYFGARHAADTVAVISLPIVDAWIKA